MAGTVYIVANNLNGKQYVGQTIVANNSVGHGKMLTQAYKKHGKQNFTYDVIRSGIECANALNYLERFWIKTVGSRTPNGYNIEHGGRRGERIADETRALMSAKSKGNQYRLGKPHSPEVIAAMKESRKNPSAETRQKLSDARKGFKFSPETIEKIRIGNRGKVVSDSTRAKLAVHNIGKIVSEETRMKLSNATKRQWAKVKGAA